MGNVTLNLNSLKIGILTALQSRRHQHKFNLLGKGSEQGDLERQLGIRFEPEQRHQAAIAFSELQAKGFIQPTYQDQISPELWVAITDKGLAALATGAVESQDSAPTPVVKELEQKFKILFSAGQAAADFAAWTADHEHSIPIVVLFIDIDNFKSMNSMLGETVVDDTLLPAFQRFLELSCRHRGFAYRQGGEEFVITLPNHTPREGADFAERLRAETEAKSFTVGSQDIRLTISVGVASSPGNGSTYVEVVRAANVAEHSAKDAGRNRVVIAEPIGANSRRVSADAAAQREGQIR